MDKKKKKGKGKKLRRFTFRGKDLDQILSLPKRDQVGLFNSRIRRKIKRGLNYKYKKFQEKVVKAIKNCIPGKKPLPVKTHLRDAVIMPQMVGGVVAIYNGRDFN